MFTLAAGYPYVMDRLENLAMLDTLRKQYSDYTIYNHFKYCETDEEYSIVYSELM